jgi:hypothetical protein
MRPVDPLRRGQQCAVLGAGRDGQVYLSTREKSNFLNKGYTQFKKVLDSGGLPWTVAR